MNNIPFTVISSGLGVIFCSSALIFFPLLGRKLLKTNGLCVSRQDCTLYSLMLLTMQVPSQPSFFQFLSSADIFIFLGLDGSVESYKKLLVVAQFILFLFL